MATNFKNCLNRQNFKFLMVTECLTCDVGRIQKFKHKSNLKL